MSYVQIYYEDQDLWDVAQELYIGILEGVEGMTEWLDSNAYKRAFEALFKQNGYGKSIDDMIKKGIEDNVVAFRERFECCLHLQIQKQGIQQGRQLETLVKMMGGIVKDQEWEKKANDNLQSGFRKMCDYGLHNWLHERVSSICSIKMEQLSSAPNPQPFIDVDQLLYLLQVNPRTPPQDIEYALREGQDMPSSWQARTAALMQNPRFQAWLKSDQSTGLVVNGMDSQADEAISSPMTYFTGLLSHTLKQMNIAMPLTHLCGLHAAPDDPLDGAKGMLRALTCQLILAYGQSLDLSFINNTLLELVVAQDIRALCELFRGLLTSVSQGTVFCILDGISWFETQAKIRDLRVTMAFLQDLINEVEIEGVSLRFKVLITNAGESQYASEWFPPSSILSLEEDIEDDGYEYDDVQMADLSRESIGL